MASVDLTEYKQMLDLDPEAPNKGPWYTKSAVHHNGLVYAAGRQLPELKNKEVSQLLDVNAITSVNPNPQAGGQQGQAQDDAGQNQSQDAGQGSGEQGPSGTTRLDENGNPVQE